MAVARDPSPRIARLFCLPLWGQRSVSAAGTPISRPPVRLSPLVSRRQNPLPVEDPARFAGDETKCRRFTASAPPAEPRAPGVSPTILTDGCQTLASNSARGRPDWRMIDISIPVCSSR